MERIICLLILASSAFAQSEFIFWAELSSRNYILFHQEQTISPAMTSTKDANAQFACEIAYTAKDIQSLPRDDFKMIDDTMPKAKKYEFLQAHKDELVECFINADVKVKDFLESNALQAKTSTYIKMLPLRFSIEFKENSALIYTLKKNP